MDFSQVQLVKRQIERYTECEDFVAIVPICEKDLQKLEKYCKVEDKIDHTQPFIIL
jgi:hypothetical protein